MNCKDLLFFNSMLTTKIIVAIYWFMILASLVDGLATIFIEGFLSGVGIIVAGIVFSRLLCEFLIVIFKINDNLEFLRDKIENDVSK